MGSTEREGSATRRDGSLRDDIVIDLTDAAMARAANENLVIDLRDHVVAAGQAGIVEPDAPTVKRSGRPADLLPGLRLEVLDQQDHRWDKAERFVYDSYRKLAYCDASERSWVEELAPWTDRSQFHVVFDEDDHVVGTARLISDGYASLPVGKFTRTDHRDPDPVQELSSVVVIPSARGLSVVAYLCRSIFFTAYRNGANAIVFLLEDGLIRLLTDHYGLPVRYLGESQHYMGGRVSPSGLSLVGREYLDTARANPHYWKWMLEAATAQEVADWDLPIVLVDDVEPEGAPAAAEQTTEATRPPS
jgi:hypothetical protein